MTDSTPGPGHNLPPAIERYQEHIDNANAWIERGVIDDDEQAGACQLAIDQLMAVKQDLEADEKAEREPHDLLVAAIHIKYRTPLKLVGASLVRLREIAGVWLGKKRDAAEAEATERERAAEEARQKANAAIEAAVTKPSVEHDVEAERATEEALQAEKLAGKGAGRAQIKGDYAAKAMSLHEHWFAEVIKGEEAAALRSFGKDPDVRKAALAKAVQKAGAMARKTKRADAAPPGFRFFKRETAL